MLLNKDEVWLRIARLSVNDGVASQCVAVVGCAALNPPYSRMKPTLLACFFMRVEQRVGQTPFHS